MRFVKATVSNREETELVYTTEQIAAAVIPIAHKYGLKSIYLFGSYARGDATESSDIDLLVDISGTHLKSLLDLGVLYCDLEEALGKPIDLIPLGSFNQDAQMPSEKTFRETVQSERRLLYAVA